MLQCKTDFMRELINKAAATECTSFRTSLLIDNHHLDVLVLLHFVPRGGIGLGPNDYTTEVRK